MKKLLRLWPVGLVLVLFVAYALAVLYVLGRDPSRLDSAGVFGDTFGALTSLFNGLAFAGLLIALGMQREDLALQRKELQLQREELKETREVMQKQEEQMRASAEAAQRQLFESTFFALLGSLQRYVEGMQYGNPTQTTEAATGREAMNKFVKRLFSEDPLITRNDSMADVVRIYKAWLTSYDHAIRPYVDLLLATLDFIQESERHNKHFYFELVRASLSRSEKSLLFYHAISIEEHQRLKNYAEHYSLFREVNETLLHRGDTEQRRLWYSHRAYDPTFPAGGPF